MSMRLVVFTQYRENYAFYEGGEYWKFKGGNEYIVANLTYSELCKLNAQELAKIVAENRSKIEYSNKASEEYIVDWVLVDKNELTPYEQDQMEFEGSIIEPIKDLTKELLS